MGFTQRVGALGEELVVRFLMKRGYKILDRNYRRPWGELDIVAEMKGKIHFVEVKSMSGQVEESFASPVPESGTQKKSQDGEGNNYVTHETLREKSLQYIQSWKRKDAFRPEDHVSTRKTKRLSRIIQTYLSGKHVSDETEWQCDVATVVLDGGKKVAGVSLLEDIII